LNNTLHKKSRAIVYIDGFNLYFGALKNTSYKWLDLEKLFQKLLGEHHVITQIKYFTARISARANNPESPDRQDAYLCALEKHCPLVKIYYGHFLSNKVKIKVHNPPKGCPPYVTAVETKEKGSDVNLALHILNDAWHDRYDCAVLVSNDSDIAGALRFAKEEHNKKIGLIIPGHRHPSQTLMQHKDFMKVIRTSVLADSQLPDHIPETNISKPASWNKSPVNKAVIDHAVANIS
jgi:hypothetical protein